MSLDDFINELLQEKTPTRTAGASQAAVAAATAPRPSAPDDGEVVKLKGEMQRLMLQVKILKAENEALKTEAIKHAEASSAAPNPAPVAIAESIPTAAPTGPSTNFPWKRHIGVVEDSLRKKQTDVAECALKVLVDVAEVIQVEPAARARLLSQLGGIRLEQGNPAEAEQTLNQALTLLQENGAMTSVSAAFCLDNLAQCYQLKENFELAEKTRRQAVTIAEEALGAEHPDVGFFRERLEALRQERSIAQIGSDERSKTILQKLTDEYNAAMSAGTYVQPEQKPLDSYSGLMLDKFVANGKQALAQKNLREAESYFRSALEKAQNVPDNDPRKCETIRMLASVLEGHGKDNEAREMYEQALSLAFKNIGWHDVQVACCLHSLATLHDRISDFGLAKNYYRQAITAFQTLRDDDRVATLEEQYAIFIDRVKSERQWKGWSN